MSTEDYMGFCPQNTFDKPAEPVIEVAPGGHDLCLDKDQLRPAPAVPAQEAPREICEHCKVPITYNPVTTKWHGEDDIAVCHERYGPNENWHRPAEPQAGAQPDATIQCIHCPHVEQWHTSGVVEGSKRGCLSCDECPGFERAGAQVPSLDEYDENDEGMSPDERIIERLNIQLRVPREERDAAQKGIVRAEDERDMLRFSATDWHTKYIAERESRKQAEGKAFNAGIEAAAKRALEFEAGGECFDGDVWDAIRKLSKPIPQEPAEPESGK